MINQNVHDIANDTHNENSKRNSKYKIIKDHKGDNEVSKIPKPESRGNNSHRQTKSDIKSAVEKENKEEDDQFKEDSCQTLYNKIIQYNNCDIVFGRYLRTYLEKNITRKSYTPYKDNITNPPLDDLVTGADLTEIKQTLWKSIISKLIYGKQYQQN